MVCGLILAMCGLVLAMCGLVLASGLAIDGFVLHTCAGFTLDLCEILPEAAKSCL